MKEKKTKDKKNILQTSRIKIDPEKEGFGILDMDAIKRDFDVFAMTYHGKAEWLSERNQSYAKALSILSAAHPVSVSYIYGQRAILLFQIGKVSLEELNQKLHTAAPDTDLAIIQVDVKNPYDCGTFLGQYNTYLVQAICNMLANTHDDYSRMDGHLYYTTSELSEKYTETLHKRIALEVAVDVDILVLRVCTFLELERDEAFKRRFRKNAPPKPLYTVQTTTGKMSRVREKDVRDTAYVQGNLKGKKSNIIFCDWRSLKKFAKTKCGILYLSFLQDLKRELSDYINLEFETSEFTHLTTELHLRYKNAEARTQRYAEILIETLGIRKIYICNHIGELGIQTSTELTQYLEKYQFEVEHCTEIPLVSNDEFIISIIHSKADYEELGIKDDYIGANYTIQHYVVPLHKNGKRKKKAEIEDSYEVDDNDTIQSETKNVDPNVFLKLLAEAIVKTDLRNGCISMVNMNTFFEDSEMSASDNFEIGIYWITKRKYPDSPEERWYPCMYINQNGIITHTDEDKASLSSKSKLDYIEEQEAMRRRNMICIFEMHENQYAISRTDEICLPSETLATQILNDAEPVLSVDMYRKYLQKFYEATKYDFYYKEALKKLYEYSKKHSSCTKRELRSLTYISIEEKDNTNGVKNRNSKSVLPESKAMMDFLQANGINIVSSFKNAVSKRESGLIGYDHVHYKRIEEPSPINHNMTECTIQYIVGELSLNQSLAKAAHVYTIRCVSNSNSQYVKEDMDSIVKMVDVFFVRENAFTVIPFLCKYAREWERVDTDHFEEALKS